jgi:hypothetical protein
MLDISKSSGVKDNASRSRHRPSERFTVRLEQQQQENILKYDG